MSDSLEPSAARESGAAVRVPAPPLLFAAPLAQRLRCISGCPCRCRGEMGDDLMAEKVEIDPLVRTSPLRAAEQAAIECAGLGKVVDGKGEVKRGERRHCGALRDSRDAGNRLGPAA